MDLSHLGTIQDDGSILLFDRNIKYREAMTGYYRRIRQSPEQRSFLGKNGYTSVLSSFISAVRVEGRDLFIRFHNNSVYQYFGFGDMRRSFLMANSKGQFFNRNVRPTEMYVKVEDLPFPQEYELDLPQVKLTDGEMFEKMEVDYLTKLLKNAGSSKLKTSKKVIRGVEFVQFDIKGITFYRPASR